MSCVNPILEHILKLQKSLDDYFQSKMKTDKGRGDLYERFIGHLFEKEKYQVQYCGCPGDGGIDLICKNNLRFMPFSVKIGRRRRIEIASHQKKFGH